jgi:hypothetical protein
VPGARVMLLPDQPYGITTHQWGHRTFAGVRVAFSTTFCSSGGQLFFRKARQGGLDDPGALAASALTANR